MQSNSKVVLLLVWLWTLLPLAASQTSTSSGGIKYSDVTFVGAHNGLCVRTQQNGFSTFGNQFYNLTTILDAGVRLIQGQGFLINGDIHICHTSCSFFDGGRLVDHLNNLKDWLSRNPSEVVTLLWVNSNNMNPVEFDKAYKAAGINDMSYIPSSTNVNDWPLVSDMVTSGKRIVSFLAQSANQQTVPYLLDEFSYVFETPFEVTSSSDFGCKVDRGKSPTTSLALLNHFLDLRITGDIVAPNVSYASVTNSGGPGIGNLMDHINSCKTTFGRKANYVLLDFIDRGDPFSVVDQFNSGPKPSRVVPVPIPATDAAGTAPNFQAAGTRLGVQESKWAITGLLAVNALLFFVF